jgi:predicted DNA-binding transcriptional regulator AlpA
MATKEKTASAPLSADKLDELRLIRWRDLARIVPYSKTRIRQLEEAGEFPKRVALGRAAVAWRYTAIAKWIADREERKVLGLRGDSAPNSAANLGTLATRGHKRATPSRRKAGATKGGR